MKRRMRPEDLLRLRWAGDVAISPDGGRIVYVESRVVADKNRYRRRLIMVRAHDEGGATALTQGEQDTAPAWSPDGRWLAFIGKRGPFRQVWLLPAAGGEARPLTSLRGGVREFAWSSDCGRLAVVAALDARGLLHAGEDSAEDDDAAPAGDERDGGGQPSAALGGIEGDAKGLERLYRKHNRDVKIIDEMVYKMDGEGYHTARRGQVCVVDVASALALEGDLTAAVRQLTFGPFDHTELAWAADGEAVYATSDHGDDYDRRPWRRGIYRVPAAGGEAARVSPLGDLAASGVAVRSDGREIAYIVHRRADQGYDNGELWLQDTTGGAPRRLAEGLDRPFGLTLVTDVIGSGPSGLRYAPDGRSLYCTVSDAGQCYLARIDAHNGEMRRVTQGDRALYAYALDERGRTAAALVASPAMPGDVFLFDLEAGSERRLSDLNRELFNEVWLSEPRRFTAVSPDGTELGGWVMEPYGREAGDRYPAALEVHGGPMMMYGQAYFHEFQVLAGAGYGVVYGNPRGSTGYGQAFCQAIQFAWGDKDYTDVMAVLDKAVQDSAWIDPDRLAVLGGSYGGFMTNWVVGHTDRFKAAVTMRSVVEWGALMGTGDFAPDWDERPGGEPPWRGDDWYRQQSPLTYVDNIVTPLLIEHQEGDLRCPIEQGEMLYTAVKWLGRAPVRFVRYPAEFHGMSRGGQPFHRVHRLRQILDWFGRYLGGEAPALTVVDRTYRERAGDARA